MPRVMLVAGGCFLPRDSWDQEGRQRWRAGSLMSGYPGATLPPQGLPWAAAAHAWDQGAGHMGRAGPAAPKLASVLLQRVFSGRAASVSSLGPAPRSRPAGSRAQSWTEEKPAPRGELGCGSTFLPFLRLVAFLSGSGQASGRLLC